MQLCAEEKAQGRQAANAPGSPGLQGRCAARQRGCIEARALGG